jgi:hypothetical protein
MDMDNHPVVYGWRQIGLRDGTNFVKILESAITWGLNDAVVKLTDAISRGIASKGLVYVLLPLMGIRNVEDKMFDWLEKMIIDDKGLPLPHGSLSDPEKFPLSEITNIIKSLNNHPGIASFFGSLPQLLDLGVIQRVKVWVEEAIASYNKTLTLDMASSDLEP